MSNSMNFLLIDFIVGSCFFCFNVKLSLYFKLPLFQHFICHRTSHITIITRYLNVQPLPDAGIRALKDHLTTVHLVRLVKGFQVFYPFVSLIVFETHLKIVRDWNHLKCITPLDFFFLFRRLWCREKLSTRCCCSVSGGIIQSERCSQSAEVRSGHLAGWR